MAANEVVEIEPRTASKIIELLVHQHDVQRALHITESTVNRNARNDVRKAQEEASSWRVKYIDMEHAATKMLQTICGDPHGVDHDVQDMDFDQLVGTAFSRWVHVWNKMRTHDLLDEATGWIHPEDPADPQDGSDPALCGTWIDIPASDKQIQCGLKPGHVGDHNIDMSVAPVRLKPRAKDEPQTYKTGITISPNSPVRNADTNGDLQVVQAAARKYEQ